MTDQERGLLMALGAYMCGASGDRARALAAAYERAAQSPAEPKPSGGANEEISLHARNAFYDALSGWNLGTKMEAMDAFVSAARLITTAKDAELAHVIRDNDEKTAEIERLKTQARMDAVSIRNLCAEMKNRNSEIDALRNPGIDAAADAGRLSSHICQSSDAMARRRPRHS